MADLKANGELRAAAAYRYENLEQLPGCAELIGQLSGAIWRAPNTFEIDVLPALQVRWLATAPSAGLMTLRSEGQLVSITVLAAGVDAQADQHTLAALQQQLVQELHGTAFEAAFSLMDLAERPLAATVNLSDPPSVAHQTLAALIDRCFAAAFFRYLRLV